MSDYRDELNLNRDLKNSIIMTQETPLQNKWVFWFTHRAPGVKSSAAEYANQLKKVATISTVIMLNTLLTTQIYAIQIENFWHTYQHLKRPSDVPIISDFQLFKDGIMPVWEVNDVHL